MSENPDLYHPDGRPKSPEELLDEARELEDYLARRKEVEDRVRLGLRVNSLEAHEEMARRGMSYDELVRFHVKRELRKMAGRGDA